MVGKYSVRTGRCLMSTLEIVLWILLSWATLPFLAVAALVILRKLYHPREPEDFDYEDIRDGGERDE